MPLKPNALCTVPQVRRSLGLSDKDSDALVESLINSSSDLIEIFTGQEFIEADRVFWIEVDREDEDIVLPNWPIQYVERVASGSSAALVVGNDESFADPAVDARVGLSDTELRLVRVTAADTVTDLIPLADYPYTIGLAAAVEALDGWTATAPLQARTLELRRGQGGPALEPFEIEWPADPVDGWVADAEGGVVRFAHPRDDSWAGWGWSGVSNDLYDTATSRLIAVTYRSGYRGYECGGKDPTIPPALNKAAIDVTVRAYHLAGADPTMRSESMGSYTYTRAVERAISDSHAELTQRLAFWMNRP